MDYPEAKGQQYSRRSESGPESNSNSNSNTKPKPKSNHSYRCIFSVVLCFSILNCIFVVLYTWDTPFFVAFINPNEDSSDLVVLSIGDTNNNEAPAISWWRGRDTNAYRINHHPHMGANVDGTHGMIVDPSPERLELYFDRHNWPYIFLTFLIILLLPADLM